jgi:hypothetical protein
MTDEDLLELYQRCGGDSAIMNEAIAAKWQGRGFLRRSVAYCIALTSRALYVLGIQYADLPERKAVEGLSSWTKVGKPSKKKVCGLSVPNT